MRRAPITASPHGLKLGILALLLELHLFMPSVTTSTTLAQKAPSAIQQANATMSRLDRTVYRVPNKFHWLADGNRLWYRVETGPESREYILAETSKSTRSPAFDHARLADALSKQTGKVVRPDQLDLEQLDFPDQKSLVFQFDGSVWTCHLGSYDLQKTNKSSNLEGTEDTQAMRSRPGGTETLLTFVNRSEEPVELLWIDPMGERLSYGKLAPAESRSQHTFAGHVWLITNMSGSPLRRVEGGTEPRRVIVDGSRKITETKKRHSEQNRSASGDQVSSPDGCWQAFIQDSNVWISRNPGPGSVPRTFPLSTDGTPENSYGGPLLWSPDSTSLLLLQTEPPQEHKVTIVESSPGDQTQPKLRTLDYLKPGDKIAHPRPRLFQVEKREAIPINEELFPNPWSIDDFHWATDSKSVQFLYNQRGHQVLRLLAVDSQTGTVKPIINETSPTFIDYAGKMFMHRVEPTDEIIWMSERDGWNHLWLIDGLTGAVKNLITPGHYVVRRVEKVDEENRQVWFFAGGVRPEQDPYYLHLCRVNFDGSGLTILTEGDGTHSVEFSPDRRFFVDTWSRVDKSPVSEIRSSINGQQIVQLEEADASQLYQAGWVAPERFKSKARDGKTDIYGVLFKPSHFNPARKYPLVEQIYAGPQGAFVPKDWAPQRKQQEMAELGFIVVQIDGLGTSNRSKAFHDVCWKKLADAGLPDRVIWIKDAARERPWIDLDRIGVYGGSAGGQNAVRALLDHGDFYKVGVADCGCHDNRMDKIWWNELWMGWPVGPEYEASSNVVAASRLVGKLLLIVGEVDNNVDPASTMQVVNALVKADKDFDMLVLPSTGHGAAETPYGRRKRAEFLMRHLFETPQESSFTSSTSLKNQPDKDR